MQTPGIGAGPSGTRLSIVIPAHNEENAIGAVLDRIRKQTDAIHATLSMITDVEVIVVDDGSSDRTAEIARNHPGVRVVTHETNRGYGAALKTGIRAAGGDVIGFLDADGTYPPEALPTLVGELYRQEADVVTGSRLGSGTNGMPLVRRIGNRMFTTLVSLVAPGRVADSASGMRVARREALDRLGLLPDGMNFIVAFATQAAHERLRTVEVPIAYDERIGQSKLRVVNDGLAFARTILEIAVLYDPLKFFTLAAALAMAAGAVLAARPLWTWLTADYVPEWAIYRLVTVLVLFVAGFSTALFGLLTTHVIALVRDEPAVSRSRVERALLSPRLPAPLALVGVALIAFGPAVNHHGIYEYVTTGHVDVPWAPILLGATAVLLGVEAVLGAMLLGLLAAVKRWKVGWLR